MDKAVRMVRRPHGFGAQDSRRGDPVKLTIGVMGASGDDLSEEVRQKAYQLGKRLRSGTPS
jgi:hypothetical protein